MSDEQPNTPNWAQPTPPQHAGWVTPPLAPRPPNKHKGLKITGAVIGVLIVIGVIASAAGGGKNNNTTPAAPAPVTTTQTDDDAKPAAAPAPKAKPKPKPAAKTVLTESGHGIKSTRTFTVDGDWDLHYTYNCTSFGAQGNFIVSDGGLGFYVNELGKKGSDVTHLHDGDQMHLEINSECSWTVKVIDIP